MKNRLARKEETRGTQPMILKRTLASVLVWGARPPQRKPPPGKLSRLSRRSLGDTASARSTALMAHAGVEVRLPVDAQE